MSKSRRRKKHHEAVHVQFVSTKNVHDEKKVILSVPMRPGISSTRTHAKLGTPTEASSKIESIKVDSTAPQTIATKVQSNAAKSLQLESTGSQSWWAPIPNWARYGAIAALALGTLIFLSRKNSPPNLSNTTQPIAISSETLPSALAATTSESVSTTLSSSELIEDDENQETVETPEKKPSLSAPLPISSAPQPTNMLPNQPVAAASLSASVATPIQQPKMFPTMTSVVPKKATTPARTSEVEYE